MHAQGEIYHTAKGRWVEQDSQCTYNVNIEAHSCNHCCNGKAVTITQPECVYL